MLVHRWITVGLGLLAAPACFAAPAVAQSEPRLEAVESALDHRDWRSAGELLGDLLVARRGSGEGVEADPLMHGLFGRLYLLEGRVGFALPYLEGSEGRDVPPEQRLEARLALARAQALSGRPEEARAQLESLAAETAQESYRRRVEFVLAEILALTDPVAALPRAQRLHTSADAETRFETGFLVARLQSLLGRRQAAAAATAELWASATEQPAHLVAPIRAALLRAVLADDAGDRERLLVMLSLAGARTLEIRPETTNLLPTCGREGIEPSDYVTFAAYAGDPGDARLEPVAASRPQAVAPFARPLAGQDMIERQGNWPAGTLFTVRCRTVPTDSAQPVVADSHARLFAANGIYLPPALEWDGDRVAALEATIARIETESADDHPSLIPLLSELGQRIFARAQGAGLSGHPEMIAIQRRMARAMRRLPGGESLVPTEEELQLMSRAMSHPASAAARHRAIWRERLSRADIDQAYPWLLTWLGNESDLPKDEALSLVRDLLERFRERRDDPRRRSLLVRLGRLHAELGNREEARRLWREAGVGEGTCLMLHGGVRMLSGETTADDYSPSALRYEFIGRTGIDYDVDASGKVRSQRVILSAPSSVFDGAATGTFGNYRYAPAEEAERFRGCSGMTVLFHWRLENPGRPARAPNFDFFGGSGT